MKMNRLIIGLSFFYFSYSFGASDPVATQINGTNIVLWRVTCTNGEWVDYPSYDEAKSKGSGSCADMGSSIAEKNISNVFTKSVRKKYDIKIKSQTIDPANLTNPDLDKDK